MHPKRTLDLFVDHLLDFRDDHMVWLDTRRARVAFFAGIAAMAIGSHVLALRFTPSSYLHGHLGALAILAAVVGTAGFAAALWGLLSLNRIRATLKARAAHPAGRGIPTTLSTH
ncbi:hypothetical protein GCM10025867_48810 (plasmid) [Frondihabitans sucicola]|uniref:DUF202 domain-containing protein n=1 Tax=Frondihabitans sucicola TaxID=1268041 RepID=A0ABM8GVX9_9MICO|nr:hypothetical protein [Frondihabitans sucicola]BDZ52640.1 hypothetical protein GCM10025867_48810 [Frondihabitans sucicola]